MAYAGTCCTLLATLPLGAAQWTRKAALDDIACRLATQRLQCLGSWWVDVTARRPVGWIGQRRYQDPHRHEASFSRVLEWLGPLQGDRCLEIGCGGGVLLERALAGGAASVAGLDHSPDMLALSMARNRDALATDKLQLKLGDAVDIPWPDQSFDAAWAANMFFFVDEPERVLAELFRVLVPGARLVIATLAGPLPPMSLTTWWTLPPMRTALRAYTEAEMVALYQQAGFSDVVVETEEHRQLSRGIRPTA